MYCGSISHPIYPSCSPTDLSPLDLFSASGKNCLPAGTGRLGGKRLVSYAIFKKLSEHETVWVGSARERREAEDRLASLARAFQKEFYALDLDSGEIIENRPPSSDNR